MLKRSICILAVFIMFLSGCANVRLTTGLTSKEFARIDGYEVEMSIANLLLSETKSSYESMFNKDVWNKDVNGITMENYVKNSVRDTLESIVYARNMAKELKINITEDEKQRIKEASEAYIGSFEEAPKGIDAQTVESFYTDLLLAEKAFYAVTDSVDTVVSTDEARMIQVQYIYLSTVTYDENNEQSSLTEGEITLKKEQGLMILEELENGAEFGALAVEYSDDSDYSMELTRGEHCEEFCDAAFALENGKTSKLVETPYGYYIIKCINYNMECDYNEQCEKIILSRRKAVFTDDYLEYSKNRVTEYNDDFWDKNPIADLQNGSGKLFEIYKKEVQN